MIMKNFKIRILFALSVLLMIMNSCTDSDDNLSNEKSSVVSTEVVNILDKELIEMLSKVVKEGNNINENIVCIDFVYPFTLIIYDSSLNVIGTKILSGDAEFSTFLGQLPVNQSLSISYPIQTTLADGTIFTVNSNTELKLAIDSCSREDIIVYCNSLFGGCNCNDAICIWNVPYSLTNNNKYASGFFENNNDGTLNFNYDGIKYNGTWTILYVKEKLHININLAGNSQVALDWNIDREIELDGNQIKILNNPKNIILEKSCQQKIDFIVGSRGPANGIVFYDKGFYSKGWRYIEAAPTDLPFLEWGCMGSQINNTSIALVGNGLLNSITISNYHDGLNNYYQNPVICNSQNNGTVVAREALLLVSDNFDDWFLPSENELLLMYQNLKVQNLGNLSNANYWTSTQVDAEHAVVINFADGVSTNKTKIPLVNNIKARAIRYF